MDIYLQCFICLLNPIFSIQHFLLPLDQCLLADICNHTWIPECGLEKSDNDKRLFIDDCDMHEYNCDHKKNYEAVNYTDCFVKAVDGACPVIKCPSHPTCPDHRFHRMGQQIKFIRLNRRIVETTKVTLPMNMMTGKRRYTPQAKKKILRNVNTNIRKGTRITHTTIQTVILKRETIIRDGIKLLKVIKGIARKKGAPLDIVRSEDDDFLE